MRLCTAHLLGKNESLSSDIFIVNGDSLLYLLIDPCSRDRLDFHVLGCPLFETFMNELECLWQSDSITQNGP